MPAFRLLIVDDESKMLRALERALEGWSASAEVQWEILTSESASDALAKMEHIPCQAVLSDIRIGEDDGVELLKQIREHWPQTEVILMTAFATVENAVEAMKAGARDYLLKPFKMDELFSRLAHVEETLLLRRENKQLRERLARSSDMGELVGQSAPMRNLRAMIQKLAGTDSTVLLRGESGTGKDLTARAIHEASARAEGPFITACCSAIPENLLESDLFGHVRGAFTGATEKRTGRFEMAAGGTLYLDEIGDMTFGTQVKLLRVLQHGEFEPVGSSQTKKADVRIIAATNRDLEKAIAEGRFRQDLFYRLNVVSLTLPPLRDRGEDIPLLVSYLVERISLRRGIPMRQLSEELIEFLTRHSWPGNVRELENAIEYALVMGEGDPLETDDLPAYLAHSEGGAAPVAPGSVLDLDGNERSLIEKALEEAGGNQTRAAKLLGITRRALGYRRAKYGL